MKFNLALSHFIHIRFRLPNIKAQIMQLGHQYAWKRHRLFYIFQWNQIPRCIPHTYVDIYIYIIFFLGLSNVCLENFYRIFKYFYFHIGSCDSTSLRRRQILDSPVYSVYPVLCLWCWSYLHVVKALNRSLTSKDRNEHLCWFFFCCKSQTHAAFGTLAHRYDRYHRNRSEPIQLVVRDLTALFFLLLSWPLLSGQ